MVQCSFIDQYSSFIFALIEKELQDFKTHFDHLFKIGKKTKVQVCSIWNSRKHYHFFTTDIKFSLPWFRIFIRLFILCHISIFQASVNTFRACFRVYFHNVCAITLISSSYFFFVEFHNIMMPNPSCLCDKATDKRVSDGKICSESMNEWGIRNRGKRKLRCQILHSLCRRVIYIHMHS